MFEAGKNISVKKEKKMNGQCTKGLNQNEPNRLKCLQPGICIKVKHLLLHLLSYLQKTVPSTEAK